MLVSASRRNSLSDAMFRVRAAEGKSAIARRARQHARRMRYPGNFELSAAANLLRPSRICARDHAANPNVSAGFGSTFIKHEDNGDGLIPMSAHTRVITGMCSFCRTQATKCNPASGISRTKNLPNNLLNCSIKSPFDRNIIFASV